jgi:hypothetical protein
MKRSGSSTILSAITGTVLLIHVLGLVALMVQRTGREILERPVKMAVQIRDQTDPTVIPILRAQEPNPADSLPLSFMEPPLEGVHHEAAPPETEMVASPPEAAAVLPPIPSTAVAPPPSTFIPPSKKPAAPSIAKVPQPQKTPSKSERPLGRVVPAKPSKQHKPASNPSDKLRSSLAAQAALKRLREPSVADSCPIKATSSTEPRRPHSPAQSARSRVSNERALEGLIAALQNCVVIPEQGEVRMRIQINAQGRVIQMECLKAASERNREVIERSLRLIRLPVEGLTHDGSVSVVVTFKHA